MQKFYFLSAFFAFFFLSIACKSESIGLSQGASDYFIDVNFDGLNTSYCACSNYDTRILCSKYGYQSGNNLIDFMNPSSNSSASSRQIVGPNVNITYYFSIFYYGTGRSSVGGCTFPKGCSGSADIGASAGYTAEIFAPYSLTASIKTSDAYIDLNWAKGSDIPDGYLKYYIYRDNMNNLVHTASGTEFSWRDLNVAPGQTHTYYIKTHTDLWGGHTSVSKSATGSTWSTGFSASDATDATRCVLKWNDLSTYSDKIEIERSSNNGLTYEQLAVLDNKYVQYDDDKGIPGFNYLYRLKPSLSNVYSVFASDTGSKKANGKFSGTVKTRFGTGVPDVVITAVSDVNVFGIIKKYRYTAITNAAGYFEINNIFYHESAGYTLTPSKGNHSFDPASQSRTLNLTVPFTDNITFTDTTRLTVRGQIFFPPITVVDTCFLRDVEILVDGLAMNVKTDMKGFYEVAVEKQGSHTIKPKLLNHVFSPASTTVIVNDYVSGINFKDMQKDSLVISLKGGCKNVIADYAKFRITSISTQGCINKVVITKANGVYIDTVPAQKYKIELLDIVVNRRTNTNLLTYFTDAIIVDLSKRDSAGHYQKAEFVYHSKPIVEVTQMPDSFCVGSAYTFLMKQGSSYKLPIKVSEAYSYKTLNVSCKTDKGNVEITNEVGDQSTISVAVKDGIADFSLVAGKPNIAGGSAHPYQKLLEVQAIVGNARSQIKDYWVLVKGHRPRTQTFVTKTPELPFFVLHDPNGDMSYSFLEKDSSVSYNYVNEYQVGGGAGPYMELKVGVEIPVPFTGIVIGAGVELEAKTEIGAESTTTNTLHTTFTATKRFETSREPEFIGDKGDVFVGASWNMIYALSDVVDYDNANCKILRDTTLAWGANGIATSYIYTEGHIRNTLIPQLKTLLSLSKGDTIKIIENYIDVWKQVLEKNELNKKKGRFIKNISFSAGAPHDFQQSMEVEAEEAIDYKLFVNNEIKAGIKLGDDVNETKFGMEANFRWSMRNEQTVSKGQKNTIGYHLEDNDPGDFFSIDVMTDAAFGTPVFKLSAGTSSCPHEEGTQFRDQPQISLDTYTAVNIPSDKPGVYTANLSNLSESNENWEFNVKALGSSNRDGAVIKVGGEIVNSNPASFYIPAGKTASVALTVEKGPLAADYEGLQVVMYSPCDAEVADTVTFSAHFQNDCSIVDLYNPGDNWIVTQVDTNKLNITFSGYNATNLSLIDVRLQYRKPGQPWNTVVKVLRSLLTQKYFDYTFNVSTLEDGDYELRAVANCGNSIGMNYSKVYKGHIDRKSIALFGKPQPSDGVLNIGENISVEFNEAMNCDLQYDPTIVFLKLKDGSNQIIPSTYVCNGKSILILFKPDSALKKYEGKTVEASIYNLKDFNGNAILDTIKWSFVVNQSAVFWSPSNLNKTVVLGQSDSVRVHLVNKSAITQSYTLSGLSSWLTAPIPSGVIPPNGQVEVLMVINQNLNQGKYMDTVYAVVNTVKAAFYLNVDVIRQPSAWKVNPASYKYSSNIIAQFSLSAANAPLSADVNDKIAAFVGNECRGMASIQYDQTSNTYKAYLTTYSNSSVGDTLTFKFWDANPGIEYKAQESLAFIANALVGKSTNPYILHSEGTLVNLPLVKGWNWISLNYKNSNMNPDNILSSLKPNVNNLVKGQSEFSQYSSSGWVGTLSNFDTRNGYEIYLDQPDTLRFAGNLLPDTSSFPLLAGWNWIGYPARNSMETGKVMAFTSGKNGDLLKSQTQFASYDSASNKWAGSLSYFNPGKSYKMFTPAAKTLKYQLRLNTASEKWAVKPSSYEFNMTVTASLLTKRTDLQNGFYVVGAFIDGVCQGVSQPVYVSKLHDFRVFMVIQGNNANLKRPVTFKLYNSYEDKLIKVSSPSLQFNPDSIIGRAANPFPITLDDLTNSINVMNEGPNVQLQQNEPNPFSQSSTMEYYLPSALQVKVTMVNNLGVEKVILDQKQQAGRHSIVLNADEFASGIYTYLLKWEAGVLAKKCVILK
jgi:hypothetical protein